MVVRSGAMFGVSHFADRTGRVSRLSCSDATQPSALAGATEPMPLQISQNGYC